MHHRSFALTFVAFFILTVGFLSLVGSIPDSSAPKSAVPQSGGQPAVLSKNIQGEAPVRVIAASIKLDVSVANPASADVEVLDAALSKGAVRYPTSGLLGVLNQTVLIFGHSSYLPIVHNQAYKTFDGIQDLKTGSIVSVYSADTEYRYRVVEVKIAAADEDQTLRGALPQSGTHLMLVTCDSFAQKTNRFVVTADFVGAYSLVSN